MPKSYEHQVGFIGGGNMAEAIIRAAISAEILPPAQIFVFDPNAARCAMFEKLGAAIAKSNHEVVSRAQQVVLAIKPQKFEALTADLCDLDADQQIVISIMAGVSSQRIEQVAGKPLRIVRVMPNTPILVGAGMSAAALCGCAKPGDDELTMRLFGAGGEVIRTSEEALHAVTAVSGSGPAYVFYLAEAMQRAADDLGLGEHADLLVRRTILGAATLLSRSSDSAVELRRKVSSPGGTTEAAIAHMNQQQLADIIKQAMHAAEKRSRELGSS